MTFEDRFAARFLRGVAEGAWLRSAGEVEVPHILLWDNDAPVVPARDDDQIATIFPVANSILRQPTDENDEELVSVWGSLVGSVKGRLGRDLTHEDRVLLAASPDATYVDGDGLSSAFARDETVFRLTCATA